MLNGAPQKNVKRRSSSILLLVRIFEKVALQEFLELLESTTFDVTRQSGPQCRCIGRKGLVTKGNTASPWLDKSTVPSEHDDLSCLQVVI